MTNRWNKLKTTMMANKMKAIAAPWPHLPFRNEVWYDRYAGVSVVFAGAP